MRVQQFQCVGNAGCARVVESRGFHSMVTSPTGLGFTFFKIRRRQPSKVKFVYRAIISVSFTFELVMMAGMKRIRVVIPGGGSSARAKGASRNDELRRRRQ